MANSRFPIDRDGNGRASQRFEVATIGNPFNFTGTTYVFKLSDGTVTLEMVEEEIAASAHRRHDMFEAWG